MVPLRALFLLLLLRPETDCALWRDRTAEENYELFTSRKDMDLEYEGTLFTERDFHDTCAIEDKSSPKTTLKCQFSGTYHIKPRVKTETFEDEEQCLPDSDPSNCFTCYSTVASEMEGADQLFLNEHQLILWIYDPESADASELNHTAVFPSESSQIVSKMLQIWGQKPAVQTYFKQKTYHCQRLPKSGLWVADIPEIPDDIIIKITGVFQECFVQRTSFVVPRPKQSFPSKENDISLCSLQSSELPIKWSACFPTAAVLLSNFGTFYTNDAFRTHIEIKILSDILTKGLCSNITVVALSDNGISFLINSTCYKREARHVFKVGAEHKLPESEILRMHSRYWCSSVYPVQTGKQLSTWAAGMSTELFVGYNEAFNKIADTASLVKIINFPNTASLTVTTVSCDSVPCEVTMLLICNACSSSRLFFLAFYNEGRQLWGLGDFCLPVPHSSAMRMIYINSALSSGLLWDDVFATPIKAARIMDIFLCLDQHYQECLMGALSTRLFSEFTFSHQTDNILESNYTQALELTSGVMSAELKPRAVENACELQHQVSHFFVGCPPGRHIAVKIYDGDICVRNVEANFVLWEIKGRTDDGYTSSMKKNYRSCFELENSSKEGLNEQYQILNSTSQNHMARPFSHDATYVFRVRILTRNYRSDVSMAKLYSFITLSTLLVCATFCYRYSLTWKSETLGRRPKGQYLTDTLTK